MKPSRPGRIFDRSVATAAAWPDPFGFWRRAPCPVASGPEIGENQRALRERISVPGNPLEASFAGAVIPIMLKRLGQDPAQTSSIILTTVTDVAGFLSVLGIATLLMATL